MSGINNLLSSDCVRSYSIRPNLYFRTYLVGHILYNTLFSREENFAKSEFEIFSREDIFANILFTRKYLPAKIIFPRK